MPLVSVLMSNYKTNPEQLIAALESVINQTLKDIEIVIINDGVEDKSYDIIKEYSEKDSRIALYPNEKNMGLSWSLNRGVTLCKGKYIARMDTDDICYPDRLEKQISFMEAHPNMILSGAWAEVFESDENTVKYIANGRINSTEEYRARLLFGNSPTIVHPTAVFNNELLKKHNVNYDYSPKYRYSEDYRMWTICSRYGEVGILEDVVLKYREAISENRITVRHEKEMKECIKNVQRNSLAELGINPTEKQLEIHGSFFQNTVKYSKECKKWVNLLISENKKLNVYSITEFNTLLKNRLYNIECYAIVHEPSKIKKIEVFSDLEFNRKIAFLKTMNNIQGLKSKIKL